MINLRGHVQVLIGLLILSISLVLFIYLGAFFNNHRITSGVSVGSVELGNLTKERAGAQLKLLADKLNSSPVHINYQEANWIINSGQLGLGLDNEETLARALEAGKEGSFVLRWREQQRIKKEGLSVKPVISVNRAQFEKKITAELGETIIQPTDAGFTITPDDRVKIVPAQMGTGIDFDRLIKAISEMMVNYVYLGDSVALTEVELPVITLTPKRTAQDIEAMRLNGCVAIYTTSFDSAQADRTYNIKVAAAALDGLLIAPGDYFSFNRIVGPRSTEAGYKNANVIVNNELVPGVGGGVCQVSSTLYNAVLLADLKIQERANHSLPVSYVPIGQDATVVYEAIDFRFTNNKAGYIYLKTLVEEDTITVKIYGDKNLTPVVDVASWITETIPREIAYEEDPNLAVGEQVVKQAGNDGFKVETRRYIWENEKKRIENMPSSHYQAVKQIIAVGTGEVAPTIVIPKGWW